VSTSASGRVKAKMNRSCLLTSCALLLSISVPGLSAQNCNSIGINTLTADVSDLAAALTYSGDASTGGGGERVDLTIASESSAGGFFLPEATAFQGPGGFSAKFSIQNTGTSGAGDAWEFVIAGENNRQVLGPPYSSGSASHGLSGWSRLNSLVVELDARESGAGENDSNSNHIAVFLAGLEQVSCGFPLPAGTSFASTSVYTIWVDFSGFNANLEIRLSGANSDIRPIGAAVSCSVNIWGTLDINSSYFTGFTAYNDNSVNQQATVMSLVNRIYVSDAHRPAGAETCAVYDNCLKKSVPGLCTPTNIRSATCTVTQCVSAFQWDVTSTLCCSFVERASWQAIDSTASNAAGDTVSCAHNRNTILDQVDVSLCGNTGTKTEVASTFTTQAVITVATTTDPAPMDTASKATTSATTTIRPTTVVNEPCSTKCPALIAILTCASTNASISAAAETPCTATDGNLSSCACTGLNATTLLSNNNFANCIVRSATTIAVQGAAHLGTFDHVYVKALTATSGIFFEGEVTNSKICDLRAATSSNNSTLVFNGGITYADNTWGPIAFEDIEMRAGSTFSSSTFARLYAGTAAGNGFTFATDSSGAGGVVTFADIFFDFIILVNCHMDSGVTLMSTGSSVDFYASVFTDECPSPFQ
jgi:hypothetical protein